MKLYRTPDPVAAAISASRRHPTLLRLICYSPLPLRVRRSRIPEGTPILRNNDLYKRELDRWQGGLIASWREGFEREHHTQVMAEMPLSLGAYEEAVEKTQQAAVIFKPPTWRGHHAAVEHFWPSVGRIRRLEECLRSAARLKTVATRDNVEMMLGALGVDNANMAVVSADELTAIGCPPKGFAFARRCVSMGNASRQWLPIIPIICRIEPQDRTLIPLYRAIKALPRVGATHLVRTTDPGKTSKAWRQQLRKLHACGSIEKKPRLWFYYTGFGRPDYERIEKANAEAKAALAEMIKVVESAPVYPLKEKRHASRK